MKIAVSLVLNNITVRDGRGGGGGGGQKSAESKIPHHRRGVRCRGGGGGVGVGGFVVRNLLLKCFVSSFRSQSQ